MVTWMALVSQIFVDADVRVFDEEEMARQWLGVVDELQDQQIVH
jgi:hypothetical protein